MLIAAPSLPTKAALAVPLANLAGNENETAGNRERHVIGHRRGGLRQLNAKLLEPRLDLSAHRPPLTLSVRRIGSLSALSSPPRNRRIRCVVPFPCALSAMSFCHCCSLRQLPMPATLGEAADRFHGRPRAGGRRSQLPWQDLDHAWEGAPRAGDPGVPPDLSAARPTIRSARSYCPQLHTTVQFADAARVAAAEEPAADEEPGRPGNRQRHCDDQIPDRRDCCGGARLREICGSAATAFR